jgi:hypothetical protein
VQIFFKSGLKKSKSVDCVGSWVKAAATNLVNAALYCPVITWPVTLDF